jgi:hypothetical protein
VVGALIRLGECLDLTDVKYADMLTAAYADLRLRQRKWKKGLPDNRGKRHDLDCAVINLLVEKAAEKGLVFETVRAAFLEGEPVFPGSAILRETHIQIAVRDQSCIVGVFRPT